MKEEKNEVQEVQEVQEVIIEETTTTPTPIQQTYINLGIVGIGLLIAIFLTRRN